MSAAKDLTRTGAFWSFFAISALSNITNATISPTLPLYVQGTLGGGTDVAGILIALAPLAAVLAMPTAGFLADRLGYRRVALVSAVISTLGILIMTIVPTLAGAIGGRLLFGLGNAAAVTLAMSWLVAFTSGGNRGKVLSIYGLSVWVGVAVGPQLSAAIVAAADPRIVFAVCVAMDAAMFALFAFAPRPPLSTATTEISAPPASSPARAEVIAIVWIPGVVACVAWCGQGLLMGFLLVHLVGAGIPATGVFGAASVFAVFAVSVIGARIALASLPDRIGPARAAGAALTVLCAGLVVLALSTTFVAAAVGAALMGVGFSPLYPSLTMLATRGLHSGNRALGLGIFGSFTSVGNGVGALLGGLTMAVADSMWAFLLAATLQLVGLAVLVRAHRR